MGVLKTRPSFSTGPEKIVSVALENFSGLMRELWD